MSVMGFLILLLIAAVCGAIGQAIGGYQIASGGCLISAGVGFVGALVGTWIATELSFPEIWVVSIEGEPFPIVWSIIGAALLTAVLGVIFSRRRRERI